MVSLKLAQFALRCYMKRETGVSDTVEREQVLAAYFPNGRLAELPGNLAQLRIVLEAIQARLTPDQVYSVRDLDAALAPLTGDARAVRTALFKLGYLRGETGGFVRCTPPATPIQPWPRPAGSATAFDQQARERILGGVFNKHGRLVGWPSKVPVLRVVLEVVQTRFAPDRVYAEKEVNAILLDVHDDYCTLRRALVDYGYLGRDHGRYWRTEPDLARPVVSE